MVGGPWDDGIQLELFPEPDDYRRSPVQAPKANLLPLADEARPAEEVERLGSLQRALLRILPEREVDIRYTRNRTVILSLRPDRRGTPVLRAHHCFREAPDQVAEAAIRLYLTRTRPVQRRRYSHLVTRFHQEIALPPEGPQGEALDTGSHHPIADILTAVNATWFSNSLQIDITFGDRIARRLMGRHERRRPRSLIVLNPLLDDPTVDRWYMEFLVFHECLHEIHPPRSDGQRMVLHPPEFQAREREHPDYVRAHAYERWLTGQAWATLKAAYVARKRRQATHPSNAADANHAP
jgi:hypothetical protein